MRGHFRGDGRTARYRHPRHQVQHQEYGNPTRGDAITTDILVGVEFTEDNTEWKQGDKFQEKNIPFVFIDKKQA